MATDWRYTISDLPADGQLCWIRFAGYYGEPVFAEFHGETIPASFWIGQDPQYSIDFFNVPRWRVYDG